MYYGICRILVWLSAKKRHANPYSFALFISVATTAGTFFRGFGSLIVQVMAYGLALIIVRLLATLIVSRRSETAASREQA
jgi:hypothetical protein